MSNTVLITGANKGIGFEIARQLGQKGWTILLGARNKERGLAAVQKLQAEGVTVEWVPIDLNDLETIHAAADKIANVHPELRVLVNNAGIPGDMDTEPLDTKTADLKATLDVNVIGNFELIKTFTPILERNHGRIINMTIPANSNRFFHPFAYYTSKTALNQMTKMFGKSFKSQHIPVDIFGVVPGGVTTDLNNHMDNRFMRSVEDGAGSVVKLILDNHHHQGKTVVRFGGLKLVKKVITGH
ncbi:carbonyl reductase [Secundilactobacillus pentosiphilus]|uniref:Carbonyl reductase n=1 Tax=Secundilactobacillus pentosiphilus TaxID=1714682 RepID=A0A1Z5IM21_9LACO|nr:SDR family NAD(P)-dependent oxidoreductase [Secundilactobacillus pentosiphilus]GAX02815.1 carbonyl reductase [Secundilactobacillus pentosiphilus]